MYYDGFVQVTDLLVLNEPTIYLDMAHKLELLDLMKKLNLKDGRTDVMVIRDIKLCFSFH
ncbi:Protein of unknown function [Bacillus wiedmannii]|uniref:Uncharacterized protein n=1 Tax=Bacillus wiedmannii TaxID=1890302 RepID=A0AB37YMV3_9BACI|nr:Protein of unknown function [Bacillus wiedmannii]